MNTRISIALASGCLALLLAAPAWATTPKPSDLPPGSGILVPPRSQGTTYHFQAPPTFPGRLPPRVPGWMLQKRGEGTPKPLPRPLLRPGPGPRLKRPARPQIIPFRPRPFTPVIPLPPPRNRAPHVIPWPAPKLIGPHVPMPIPRPIPRPMPPLPYLR